MRLRLDVAYDGSEFSGWAVQPGLRTVQGELQDALTRVLRAPDRLSITCAGRTDAGVHARGQVCHVDVPDDVLTTFGVSRSTQGADPVDLLVHRLGSALSTDVRVRSVSVAPPGFDARFSAVWRRYAYRICDDVRLLDPLRRHEVLAHRRPLEVARLNEASVAVTGEHDFAAFCRPRAGATTVRTLRELSWSRDPDGLVTARVIADAFCHHMVRALVGCLIAVGEGRRPVDWPGEVLRAGVRDSAVTVVAPHGLTLEEVGYPDDADLAARAEQSRRLRILPGPNAVAGPGE